METPRQWTSSRFDLGLPDYWAAVITDGCFVVGFGSKIFFISKPATRDELCSQGLDANRISPGIDSQGDIANIMI